MILKGTHASRNSVSMAGPSIEKWRLYFDAARRKARIARYHLSQLEQLLNSESATGEVPIPIQAHFEGVVFSAIAATDQTAQGINSALGLGANERELFDKAFGTIAGTVPGLGKWLSNPIGRDLRGLRRLAIHHSYQKTSEGPRQRWNVEPTRVPYDGSRELQAYCTDAVAYVEELVGLLPAVESELLRILGSP